MPRLPRPSARRGGAGALVLLFAVAALRRVPVLGRIWALFAGTRLGRMISARPHLWQLLHSPFIHAEWRARERVERLLDHYEIVEQLGRPFDLPLHGFADLAELAEIGTDYRLKLDSPGWVFRDGLLTLSLWSGPDRLFSLHFLFGREDGRRVAFIGGIQGRSGENAREQYRAFAQEAAGMHPGHVLVELFRAMCRESGIERILAVSNTTRHQRAQHYTKRAGYTDPVELDYDALWLQRSAEEQDGLFEFAVILPERDEAAIPRSKRARHRARRHLLRRLQQRIAMRLADVRAIPIDRHAEGSTD